MYQIEAYFHYSCEISGLGQASEDAARGVRRRRVQLSGNRSTGVLDEHVGGRGIGAIAQSHRENRTDTQCRRKRPADRPAWRRCRHSANRRAETNSARKNVWFGRVRTEHNSVGSGGSIAPLCAATWSSVCFFNVNCNKIPKHPIAILSLVHSLVVQWELFENTLLTVQTWPKHYPCRSLRAAFTLTASSTNYRVNTLVLSLINVVTSLSTQNHCCTLLPQYLKAK